MSALIALVIAFAAAYLGHTRSRAFSRKRLRYTRVRERPFLSGLAVGAGTAILATPIAAILPFIGTGTALALGVGVGTGVGQGASDEPPA